MLDERQISTALQVDANAVSLPGSLLERIKADVPRSGPEGRVRPAGRPMATWWSRLREVRAVEAAVFAAAAIGLFLVISAAQPEPLPPALATGSDPASGQAAYTWPLVAEISAIPVISSPDFTADAAPGSLRLAAPLGTQVRAATAGLVQVAGYRREFGNLIIIDGPDGLETWYGHLSGLTVSPGDPVEQGQIIGRSGATGYTVGPSFLFVVRRNGSPVDPMSLFR